MGGPFPEGVTAPRAVLKQYFDSRCPTPTTVPKSEVDRIAAWDATALSIMQQWQEKLASDDPCVQIDRNAGPLFDHK